MLGLTGASNSAASAKQLPGGVRPGGMVEPGYLLDVEVWFKFNMVKHHKLNGESSVRLKGFKGRTCWLELLPLVGQWLAMILLIHFIGEHMLHMSLPMIPRACGALKMTWNLFLPCCSWFGSWKDPQVSQILGKFHTSRCEHPWLLNSPGPIYPILISHTQLSHWIPVVSHVFESYPTSYPMGILPWWGNPTDPGDFAAWLHRVHRAPAEVRATESGRPGRAPLGHGNSWETMRVQLLIFVWLIIP